MKRILSFLMFTGFLVNAMAQENINNNYFRQLGEGLPTPNTYRTASGAPGHEYWQQRADYRMNITLDDEKQRIYGEETITYFNNSPDDLDYLWIQLDQNMRAKDSDTYKVQESSIGSKTSSASLKNIEPWFDGGFKLEYVKDANGKPLKHTVNKTMMRVDLPNTLRSKSTTIVKIKWWYNINDREKIGGRSGYEYFKEDNNYLYTIAQFFPRMCVYSDVEGWQNKQFLGRGEFALPFGNYDVSITAPSDHIIGATGELQNASSVLSGKQRSRWEKAKKNFDTPVIIATQEEAEAAERGKSQGTKTWRFKATNVRDFGFASSRKFIWDAMAVKMGNRTVMAMSYYPKEGNPLWEQYSTKVVAQTLRTYSKHTFDYPYPVAISVNAASIGMEYPMICFNYGRPEKDGTYSERIKYGMIGVIIHEVGHNYFPMIVNSDERQWTWMDEGLNTFCQFLTEQEFDRNYPSRRGPARNIVDYMKGDKSRITPIMTNSESIFQFGNNAYGKPATALNILRETILGRELFDFAFKTYAQRWMFKHPTPADFFRTMEDASGVDLDWFWRGWFYTTDHVDMAIKDMKWYQIDTQDPDLEMPFKREQKENEVPQIYRERNLEDVKETYLEKDPRLADFYTNWDRFKPNKLDREESQKYIETLSDEEIAMLKSGKNYYELTFEKIGGIPMPLIVEFTLNNGEKVKEYIPAEIWKMGQDEVKKVFVFKEEVVDVVLDPWLETADTEISNNYWPPRMKPSKFKMYKSYGWDRPKKENEMQRYKRGAE